jgi:hypothetical protein
MHTTKLHIVVAALLILLFGYNGLLKPLTAQTTSVHVSCECGCDENSTSCCCAPIAQNEGVSLRSCGEQTQFYAPLATLYYTEVPNMLPFIPIEENKIIFLLSHFHRMNLVHLIDHPPQTTKTQTV